VSDAPAVADRPVPTRRASTGRFLRTPTAAVGTGLCLLTGLVAVAAPVVMPGDPFATVADPFQSPSWAHPMGTDDLGRDLLAAVVHGARTSMIVVVSVVVISTVIGVLVGLVAGYRGGLADDVLMRVTEMFQAVPRFFLAILAVALLGGGIGNVILVLALTSWPWLARVVRAQTMSVKGRDFVTAARAMGVAERTTAVRHVLPNVAPAAMVVVTLTAARVILLEASLGFLGLGDPNAMSWGYLADNAQRFLRSAWWMSFFPGLAIVTAVLGFSLLGDALVDAREPLAASVPKRRRRMRMTVALALTLAVAIMAVAALGGNDDPSDSGPATAPVPTAPARGDDTATVEGLRVGDCVDRPDKDPTVTLALVSCALAHSDEVFAVVSLPAEPGAAYPNRIDDEAQRLCSDPAIEFVAVDPQRSELAFDWLTPTEQTWAAGARTVACVVTSPDGAGLTGNALGPPIGRRP